MRSSLGISLVSLTTPSTYFPHTDPSLSLAKDYATHPLLYFTLEPTLSILCACIPCLGPLFRRKALSSQISTLDSLNNDDDVENDDASILRRLGATCEVSIYTVARENMSTHFKSAEALARKRPAGREGVVFVRNSTHID